MWSDSAESSSSVPPSGAHSLVAGIWSSGTPRTDDHAAAMSRSRLFRRRPTGVGSLSSCCIRFDTDEPATHVRYRARHRTWRRGYAGAVVVDVVVGVVVEVDEEEVPPPDCCASKVRACSMAVRASSFFCWYL